MALHVSCACAQDFRRGGELGGAAVQGTGTNQMGPRNRCVSSINRANRTRAVRLRVVSFLWCPRILGEVGLLVVSFIIVLY